MASQRRAQVVQLAELLEIEFEPGVGTAELMTACIAEVEGRGRNWGEEPEESEGPPEGFRPALRSVATEAPEGPRSRRRGCEPEPRAEEREVDAAEESGGEVAPALTYTRREKRRGGVRKAS